MLELLIVIGVVYAIQIFFVVVLFYANDYKKKANIYRDLVPFYWLKLVVVAIITITIEKWKELDSPNPKYKDYDFF